MASSHCSASPPAASGSQCAQHLAAKERKRVLCGGPQAVDSLDLLLGRNQHVARDLQGGACPLSFYSSRCLGSEAKLGPNSILHLDLVTAWDPVTVSSAHHPPLFCHRSKQPMRAVCKALNPG